MPYIFLKPPNYPNPYFHKNFKMTQDILFHLVNPVHLKKIMVQTFFYLQKIYIFVPNFINNFFDNYITNMLKIIKYDNRRKNKILDRTFGL